MKYNYIINKIDNFYKLSGLLQYPVKMHQEILDWASSIYCLYIVDEINDMIANHELEGDSLKKAVNFKNFLMQSKIKDKESVKKFKINFNDVGFLSKEIEYLKNKNPEWLNQYITVVFLPYTAGDIIEEGEQFGEFDPSTKIITLRQEIPLQISPSSVTASLSNISNTIRHELQHVVQCYAQILKQVSWENIGTPSTKIAPIQTIEEERELPARLKNIEFYPHLSDTINNLKSLFQLLPKKLHKSIWDVFLGKISFNYFIINATNFLSQAGDEDYITNKCSDYLNNLLVDIKEYRVLQNTYPKKYEKLIKEIYKSLSDYWS